MTHTMLPCPTHIALAGLSRAEAALVTEQVTALDLTELADATGIPVPELLNLPKLSPIRGTFRTPWPLLRAVHGAGYGSPAQSRGEILRRLNLTCDRRAYLRLASAAEFFGIELPATVKDGPPVGQSPIADEAAVRDAFDGADTMKEVLDTFGFSVTAKTYTRLRRRGAQLGLPDPTWTGGPRPRPRCAPTAARRPAVTVPAMSDTAPPQTADDKPSRHRSPWTSGETEWAVLAYRGGCPASGVAALLCRTTGAVAQQLSAAGVTVTGSPQCRICSATLPDRDGTGRRREYCSTACLNAARWQRDAEANRAEKAATQQPCRHCRADIEPGPRAREFCSKSCCKKFRYAERRAAARTTV